MIIGLDLAAEAGVDKDCAIIKQSFQSVFTILSDSVTVLVNYFLSAIVDKSHFWIVSIRQFQSASFILSFYSVGFSLSLSFS